MANKFITALFGDYSKKEVKRLGKTKRSIQGISKNTKITNTQVYPLSFSKSRKIRRLAEYFSDDWRNIIPAVGDKSFR